MTSLDVGETRPYIYQFNGTSCSDRWGTPWTSKNLFYRLQFWLWLTFESI